MNTTTASQGTVEHIDPNAIIIEANVRPSAPLTKEFVASIRENGVLTPVLARRDAQGNVLVRAGQRRTLAAREAGLSSIPAYIVEADEATVERIVQQMVENDQREALTDGERAAAFQQLAFEGLSVTAIAKRTGTKQAVVKSGLAVAENAVAASAIQEHQLTLDQAATLIEFEDDETTRADLIGIAINDPGQFAHAAQRARDERARAQVKAQTEDELRGRGYEILDRDRGYYETDYISIRELTTAEGERVTPEHIENAEGRAVFVRVYFDGEPNVSYFLSDPKAAGFARELMTTDRTANVNALTALVRSVDLNFDARRRLTVAQIREIAKWRVRDEELAVGTARAEAVRMAKRIAGINAELRDNLVQITELIMASPASPLLQERGIGPLTVAIAYTAWSHPGRVHSEAAFAALAGVSPVAASSGNTVRHRLNRRGDRRLNRALHMAIVTKMIHDPTTRAYTERRLADGKTTREIRRCLKRFLARHIYRSLNALHAAASVTT